MKCILHFHVFFFSLVALVRYIVTLLFAVAVIVPCRLTAQKRRREEEREKNKRRGEKKKNKKSEEMKRPRRNGRMGEGGWRKTGS